MAESRKSLPSPTPETQEFWDGAKAGELRLQRCLEPQCAKVYFPPRPFCPACGSRNVEWFRASGRGKLHSYVINHRPAFGFENEVPYSIGVVLTDEGVKMMTNIRGVEQTPEALQLDMPLEVTFEPVSDTISLPYWKPAAGGAA
ncbi:MAG: Zn-ribbon domain-containing OB-fold protein, partial [Hyphomicrobiales bacterium]